MQKKLNLDEIEKEAFEGADRLKADRKLAKSYFINFFKDSRESVLSSLIMKILDPETTENEFDVNDLTNLRMLLAYGESKTKDAIPELAAIREGQDVSLHDELEHSFGPLEMTQDQRKIYIKNVERLKNVTESNKIRVAIDKALEALKSL